MRNYSVIRNNRGKPEAATVLRQLKSGKYLVRTDTGIIEEDGSSLFDYILRDGWNTIEEAIGDIECYNWKVITMEESNTFDASDDTDGIDSLDGKYFWGGGI